jgi:OOP family OmpA-OmpF porin
VAVKGHSDIVGNAEFNLQLSRQRAAAVNAELQRNGVPGSAILSGGVGEQNVPVATPARPPSGSTAASTSPSQSRR